MLHKYGMHVYLHQLY